MSHIEQVQYCESVRNRFPWFFTAPSRILDVGALDVNGNNRYLFPGCDYIGLDVGEGPNVDVVCIGHEYAEPDGSFDVVMSTNAFEHDMYFNFTLKNMVRLLRPDGLMFWTCKTTGCTEHGTARTDDSSPLTCQIEGWKDYYGNVSKQMAIDAVNPDEFFANYEWGYNRSGDIVFCGLKNSEKEELPFTTDEDDDEVNFLADGPQPTG